MGSHQTCSVGPEQLGLEPSPAPLGFQQEQGQDGNVTACKCREIRVISNYGEVSPWYQAGTSWPPWPWSCGNAGDLQQLLGTPGPCGVAHSTGSGTPPGKGAVQGCGSEELCRRVWSPPLTCQKKTPESPALISGPGYGFSCRKSAPGEGKKASRISEKASKHLSKQTLVLLPPLHPNKLLRDGHEQPGSA